MINKIKILPLNQLLYYLECHSDNCHNINEYRDLCFKISQLVFGSPQCNYNNTKDITEKTQLKIVFISHLDFINTNKRKIRKRHVT